jgi:small subunit ribosomal protein S15Ae
MAFPVYFLPFGSQWGYVVITTPNGVLDHEEAIRQNVGGQVLGYFH